MHADCIYQCITHDQKNWLPYGFIVIVFNLMTFYTFFLCSTFIVYLFTFTYLFPLDFYFSSLILLHKFLLFRFTVKRQGSSPSSWLLEKINCAAFNFTAPTKNIANLFNLDYFYGCFSFFSFYRFHFLYSEFNGFQLCRWFFSSFLYGFHAIL